MDPILQGMDPQSHVCHLSLSFIFGKENWLYVLQNAYTYTIITSLHNLDFFCLCVVLTVCCGHCCGFIWELICWGICLEWTLFTCYHCMCFGKLRTGPRCRGPRVLYPVEHWGTSHQGTACLCDALRSLAWEESQFYEPGEYMGHYTLTGAIRPPPGASELMPLKLVLIGYPVPSDYYITVAWINW